MLFIALNSHVGFAGFKGIPKAQIDYSQSEARSIVGKIYNIYSRSQNYRDNNSFLYTNIKINSLCTSANMPGACGINNDGFYKGGNYSYSVTSSSDGRKINIIVRGIKDDAVGKFAKQHALTHSSQCSSAVYQAGVLTVTYEAPYIDFFLLCDNACVGTDGDLTGQDFLTCLGTSNCISAGITKDNDVPSSNLGDLFNPISTLTKYPNLNAGNTILNNFSTCRSNVVGAGTNGLQCITALTHCGPLDITESNIGVKDDTYPWLTDCGESICFYWCGRVVSSGDAFCSSCVGACDPHYVDYINSTGYAAAYNYCLTYLFGP